MRPWLRRIAVVLLLSVVTLAGVTARMLWEGEQAMRESDAAFDRGALLESIALARRAATLYAPGAPHVGAAYERLVAIAVGAEATGRREIARRAWEATRAAALETRHLWVPRSEELRRANRNLARLAAANEAERRQRTQDVLARHHGPRAGWMVLLGAGFSLAIAGLGALVFAANPGGRLSMGRLRAAALLTVLGVACWTMAVYRA